MSNILINQWIYSVIHSVFDTLTYYQTSYLISIDFPVSLKCFEYIMIISKLWVRVTLTSLGNR